MSKSQKIPFQWRVLATVGHDGTVFCFTEDGNTVKFKPFSNFQFSGSYSNLMKHIWGIEMD